LVYQATVRVANLNLDQIHAETRQPDSSAAEAHFTESAIIEDDLEGAPEIEARARRVRARVRRARRGRPKPVNIQKSGTRAVAVNRSLRISYSLKINTSQLRCIFVASHTSSSLLS